MPPTGAAFSDYHHDPKAIIQPTKTRKDRNEINAVPDSGAQLPAHPPAPQIVYLPAPAPIYYRGGGRLHQGSDSPEPQKRGRASSSPPLVHVSYPLVEDWLMSLKLKEGADKRDFMSMRNKFAAEKYLDMNIQDLSRVPHTSLGKHGFEFLLAEVSFLLKWLDTSMDELDYSHNSGRVEGKKPRRR